MVNYFIKPIFLVFLLLTSLSRPFYGQSNNNIIHQKSKLSALQSEIKSLEKELNSKSDSAKKTVSTLQSIKKQILLLNKIIKRLRSEENRKEKKIMNLQKEIKLLENNIGKLQKDYGKYIVWLYKYGDSSILNSIFNSSSISQALIRYKYLAKITDKNKKILNNLINDEENLKEMIAVLKKEQAGKEKLLKQREKEKALYAKRKTEKENLIAELKKDKAAIEDEIVKKRRNEIKIKSLIAKLIERERASKAKFHEERAKGKNVKLPSEFDYSNFESFAQLEGKLSWPVSSGRIVRDFGENENKKLKTVTLNYGIDIETEKAAQVHAVAEGIVSAIEWIPGYGSVVIVTHKDEFRTVYGHLADIAVEEGNKVKAGDVLGNVSEDLEGNILHFEIWNERNYQNPEDWLAKK